MRNCEITTERRRKEGKKRDGVGQAKNVSEIIGRRGCDGGEAACDKARVCLVPVCVAFVCCVACLVDHRAGGLCGSTVEATASAHDATAAHVEQRGKAKRLAVERRMDNDGGKLRIRLGRERCELGVGEATASRSLCRSRGDRRVAQTNESASRWATQQHAHTPDHRGGTLASGVEPSRLASRAQRRLERSRLIKCCFVHASPAVGALCVVLWLHAPRRSLLFRSAPGVMLQSSVVNYSFQEL